MINYAILGNTNNPITNQPNQPYSWFVKSFMDGLLHNNCNVLLIDYKTNSINKIEELLINNNINFVFTHLTFHHFKPTGQVLEMFKRVTKIKNTKFIHCCHDAREKDRYMKDISNYIHFGIVGTHGMKLNCEQAWKIPVIYQPYASLTYDTIGDYVKPLDFGCPVFTGSDTSHKDRSDFIKKLHNIMQIKIIKTQGKNDLREQTLNLSASSIILGLCTGYDIDGYIDVRPFQYLGAGACMIMRKFKKMDVIIPDDLYYSFDSYDDPQIVKEYWNEIKNTDTYPIRRKAFNYIQRYHSSKKQMKNLIKLLKEL